MRKKPFPKDGKIKQKNTTLVFVPRTRGRLWVVKLKENKDRMVD